MSCCRDAYTAQQHRQLAKAQEGYDARLPEDPEEVAEQRVRREAEIERKIDELYRQE